MVNAAKAVSQWRSKAGDGKRKKSNIEKNIHILLYIYISYRAYVF